MISDIVLTLAVIGGVRELLPEQGLDDLSGRMSGSLRDSVISTKADLMEFLERDGVLSKLSEVLDDNNDGVVDARELAVMEMRGVVGTSFDLSPLEAFMLADGAVREDGDISTSYVSEHDLKDMIVRGMWANLLSAGDTNLDQKLDHAEWETLVSEIDTEVGDVFFASTSADGGLIAPGNYAFPDSGLDGTEALVAAGIVLGSNNGLYMGNNQIAKRRMVFFIAGAVAVTVAMFAAAALADHIIESNKRPHWRGCYVDDHHRDIDDYIPGYSYGIAGCLKKCFGYKYFALQNGSWCTCGNRYGTEPKYHKVRDSECDSVNGRRKGGPWRNAVFERK